MRLHRRLREYRAPLLAALSAGTPGRGTWRHPFRCDGARWVDAPGWARMAVNARNGGYVPDVPELIVVAVDTGGLRRPGGRAGDRRADRGTGFARSPLTMPRKRLPPADGSIDRPFYVHDLSAPPRRYHPRGWTYTCPWGGVSVVSSSWWRHVPAPFLRCMRSREPSHRGVSVHPLATHFLADNGQLRATAASFVLRLGWALEADPTGTYAALDAAWWVGGPAMVTEVLDTLVAGLARELEGAEV